MANARLNPKWNVGQKVVVVWEGKPHQLVIEKIGNKLMTVRGAHGYSTRFDITQDPPRERREIGSHGELYTLEEYELVQFAEVAIKRIRRLIDGSRTYGHRWSDQQVQALEELAKFCPELKE